MKQIFLLIAALSMLFKQDRAVDIVTQLQADSSKKTYELINSVLSPGYNVVEVSDCSHPSFGDHITQQYDDILEKDVFVFHAHVEKDTDRCKKFDRSRTEIKTYGKSPEEVLGTLGETHVYTWLFKLDKNFKASSGFTHIHQIKAVGGPEDKMPTLTYTLRDKNDKKSFDIRFSKFLTQESIASTDLEPFLGEWIMVKEIITYGEEGKLEVTLSRKRDQKELLSYKGNLRMWKTKAQFLRPKWGIYRSLKHADQLRDEQVFFADFEMTQL
ncbi:fibronectin type III [Nonlabens sp. Asnod3-H03]|uniref:fibronectin type III n=1 Tax=Nonlabens sp. Asnod3-H03 TaxID=3160580 RepID=UPI0038680151